MLAGQRVLGLERVREGLLVGLEISPFFHPLSLQTRCYSSSAGTSKALPWHDDVEGTTQH